MHMKDYIVWTSVARAHKTHKIQCRAYTQSSKSKMQLEAGHSKRCITHASHSLAFKLFLHFVTLWPWPLTFQYQNHITCRISQGHSVNHVWILWDHSFSSYLADRQTHRITDADERLKPYSHRTRGVASMHVKVTTFGHLAIICILLDARRRGRCECLLSLTLVWFDASKRVDARWRVRCERGFTSATVVGMSSKTHTKMSANVTESRSNAIGSD